MKASSYNLCLIGLAPGRCHRLCHTLVSMAAGLSSQGLIPVVHTIAPFVTERCLEQIKLDLLSHPAVKDFSRSVWDDIKTRLSGYAERVADDVETEPDQVERWLSGLGQKVLADPELAAKVNGWVVELVTYAVEQAREEVAKLIAATVGAWDANATSRKIELQIGRDLQFIRINGTLVGGMVGVLLHLIAVRFAV